METKNGMITNDVVTIFRELNVDEFRLKVADGFFIGLIPI